MVAVTIHLLFLLVNYTNLYPISHRFRVITAYWSDYRF